MVDSEGTISSLSISRSATLPWMTTAIAPLPCCGKGFLYTSCCGLDNSRVPSFILVWNIFRKVLHSIVGWWTYWCKLQYLSCFFCSSVGGLSAGLISPLAIHLSRMACISYSVHGMGGSSSHGLSSCLFLFVSGCVDTAKTCWPFLFGFSNWALMERAVFPAFCNNAVNLTISRFSKWAWYSVSMLDRTSSCRERV